MFIFIFISKYFHNNEKANITFLHAFIIGVAQTFALMPGISRSGITIVFALILGYSFKRSTQFSFYLAIPILFFAGLDSIYNNYNLLSFNFKLLLLLIIGFLSSAVFGYFILRFLNIIIQKHRYWYFSMYCLLISIILTSYNYG